MSDFDFKDMASSNVGLDAFFEEEPTHVTPVQAAEAKPPASPKKASRRIKVGSLQQLDGFVRTAEDQLVHKSDRDLWSLKKEGESFYIERLFDDTGSPLKG